MDHTYRSSRYDLEKNIIESEKAPVRLIGQQIWDRIRRLPKIIKVGKYVRLLGYGV